MVFIAVGEEVLKQRRRLPVFRVIALEALSEGNCHGPIQKCVFAIYLFTAAPTWVARKVGLWPPEHEDLAVVLRGLGDEAGLIALDGGGLADEIGVPCLAHPGRLRELCSGDWLARAACFALHHTVNALGAADIGNAEPGDAGARAQAVDLLVRGHEREKIVDAGLRREVRIVEGIRGLLRNGGSERQNGKTEQGYKVVFHDVRFRFDSLTGGKRQARLVLGCKHPKLIKWVG